MSQYAEMLEGGASVRYNMPTPSVQQNIQKQHFRHGEMLDTFDPNKESLYEAFDTYFNYPTMTKIKDVKNYSVYMSKTYCLLSNECRYIIVFVSNDSMPTRTQERLIKLKWDSLQTRTLPDQHSLPPHGYQPRRLSALNVVIRRDKVQPEASTYTCDDLPIMVTLLHTKNGSNDYQDKGTVVSALETYQTIITLR